MSAALEAPSASGNAGGGGEDQSQNKLVSHETKPTIAGAGTNNKVGATAPWGVPPIVERIPEALRPYPRWVVWRGVPKMGKPGKVDKFPYRPHAPGSLASTKTPAEWGTYTAAVAAYKRNPKTLSGIGFVLTTADEGATVPTLDGLIAVDLDHCVDRETGVIEDWAIEIVTVFNTYTEISPSGTGLRLLGTGRLPGKSICNIPAGVEIYNGDTARFVTVTGKINGAITDIRALEDEAIKRIYAQYAPRAAELDHNNPQAVTLALWPPTQAEALYAQCKAWLPDRTLAFLDTDGAVEGERSDKLQQAAKDLCARLTDEEAFNVLWIAPYGGATALEKRNGNTPRALKYLADQVRDARKVVGLPITEQFDDLGPLDSNKPKPRLINAKPMSAWAGRVVPPRDWIVDGWIPRGYVTLLMGEGGVGKSLLMLQLQIAMALNTRWLGLDTLDGTSLGLYCEDDDEELNRRALALATENFADVSALDHAYAEARIQHDNLLVTFDGRDQARLTPLLNALAAHITEKKFALVVLDTLADFFGGNENNRSQVTQFVRALGRVAHDNGCAIVVCGHPSLSGVSSGAGTSGSTAWSNAVRSRLYLRRDKDDKGIERNPRRRVLSAPKANYRADGASDLTIEYTSGTFRAVSGVVTLSEAQVDEEVFLDCLRQREGAVSTSPKGNYAPKLFAKYLTDNGRAISAPRLEAAMNRLLAAKKITEAAPVRENAGAKLVIANGY